MAGPHGPGPGPGPGPGGRPPRGVKPQVKDPGKLFARLMKFVFKKYKWHYILVLVCICIGVFASVQGTMFQKSLIDDYIGPMLLSDQPDFSPLLSAMSKVAVFYLIGVVAVFIQNRIMIFVAQGVLRDMRDKVFGHMEKLPIKYFDTHSHGDIMSVYTNDIDTLRQLISQSIPQVFNSGITIVTVLISMLILSVPLTVVTLLMVVVVLWASKIAAGKSGKYFVEQQRNLGGVNGFIEEMISGQKIVKVFCHENENKEKFKELNDALFVSADRANTFGNCLGPINAQLGNVSYVVCAIVGVF